MNNISSWPRGNEDIIQQICVLCDSPVRFLPLMHDAAEITEDHIVGKFRSAPKGATPDLNKNKLLELTRLVWKDMDDCVGGVPSHGGYTKQ